MPILACITRREVQHLAQQDEEYEYIMKLLISTSYEPTENKKSIKTMIERQRTEQLLILFFLLVENPPIRPFIFHHPVAQFYCIRVAREKSPHRTSTGAGHVRTDGITPFLRFSTTTAKEQTVPGKASPHTPPATSYLPADSQMLGVWVSFLRHSLRHFPERNLVNNISFIFLLRLMVPRREPRALSPFVSHLMPGIQIVNYVERMKFTSGRLQLVTRNHGPRHVGTLLVGYITAPGAPDSSRRQPEATRAMFS